jgi:hypothetical protein
MKNFSNIYSISKTLRFELKPILDSIKDLQHFIKPLLGKGDEPEKDTAFYSEFESLWKKLDENITPLYNRVRNYITQKPYSTEKIKLNFNNSTLLKGWDVNKETDNTGVILRKDDMYYLAIMDKKHNKVFEEDIMPRGNGYEKMTYKQIANPANDLPNLVRINGDVVMKKGRKDTDGINRTREKILTENLPQNINSIRISKSHLSNKEDLAEYIRYYQELVKDYFSSFNFTFKKPEDYKKWTEFTDHCNAQGYSLNFGIKVPETYINELIEQGKIYLFQIYNKDFSPYSKGTPNMHTLYWKMLFDPENLKNVVYKLNGEAEIFFREQSLSYTEEIWEKGHHYDKLKKKFKYPIISKRRYADDKFQFYVPITLNFKAEKSNKINDMVNEYIKNKNIRHIIGIDRGERHLLYLSLIDLQGDIIKQFSLNEIANEHKGDTYKTNYHELLDEREGDRDMARKSWETIEKIKDLKEGYLSQVIHKITALIVEYNAIVALEDLSFRFMRGRQKVEKQVYQKFEKMLIDKLNYLVDKKKDRNEAGGLLKAYQLTGEFKSFKRIGKQNGFLFYVPAWNTSKIDPVTGFVSLFDTRYYNVAKAKEFFEKFKDVRYNKIGNYFEFVIDDYTKFNTKMADTRKNWVICTYGERIETSRDQNNKWSSRKIVLTNEFIDLFKQYDMDIENHLKQSIVNKQDRQFFIELLRLFKLTTQMRNTDSETDFLISPVADKNGNFFDSRNNDPNLPDNADANGAYNIARKGLLMIKKIESSSNLNKADLQIKNTEWLEFVQNGNN